LRTGNGRALPPLLRAELDRLRRRLVLALELIAWWRPSAMMHWPRQLWDALDEIVKREGLTMRELVFRIEAMRRSGERTRAVRIFVLNYFREAATEEGHRQAGHGGLRS
jgi:hypothetical protein